MPNCNPVSRGHDAGNAKIVSLITHAIGALSQTGASATTPTSRVFIALGACQPLLALGVRFPMDRLTASCSEYF
jgi:hypothetical protein